MKLHLQIRANKINAIQRGRVMDDCIRLIGVTRFLDLPALKLPLKSQAGNRHCGD
jgi:hypothetical protein